MNPNPPAARRALLNAQQAIRRGDRLSARRWAGLAASLQPDLEEAWLVLASLASPRASVAYLEQALRINPHSREARQSLPAAVERLRQEEERTDRQVPERKGDTRPVRLVKTPVVSILPAKPPAGEPPPRSLTRYRRSFLTLLLFIACLIVGWAAWPGNAMPALAFIRQNIVPPTTPTDPGAPAEVLKPTYTPTATSTFTVTPTPTVTPTYTLTPTSTDTPIPTATFIPLPTSLPTITPLPQPTLKQYAGPGGPGPDERWIDVDLSEQRLYAYQGDTVVASFLVSTGVWQYPTVTGQFHIYVKYLYTDMAGHGYYLPNVPYTMYFYKGYGIHGTYWHHNFGHPMSHGCINMYTPDAEWMFNWASVGTLVNIHY